MNKFVISIVLVNLLAACASEKPKEVAPETTAAPVLEVKAPPTRVEAPSSVTPAAAAAPQKTEIDPLNDPSSMLSKRSVYYPFDVSAVQDADKPLVQAHARYLSEHANRKVRLEGNCDERGSNEYNIALGQRRADGVKKMLELGGAKSSQLDTFSYGEEKPRASGHDEASWAQNRRTDLIYK